jgi:UDP-N-acetylmuramate: L-alanyl-gamma-D-glutamyl-meso-diaminopimelate ligase
VINKEQMAEAFKLDDLIIYTKQDYFKNFLFTQDFKNKALLLMSSGNYGGLDFEEVKGLIR